MLTISEITEAYRPILHKLHNMATPKQVIFSISPIRYLRDGFVANQQSKSTLHLAISELVSQFDHCHYFPAYELLIDDLRDYRFYEQDRVHPAADAQAYIWKNLSSACLEKDEYLDRQLRKLQDGLAHRPRHLGSPEFKKFNQHLDALLRELKVNYPDLDFSSERKALDKQIEKSLQI